MPSTYWIRNVHCGYVWFAFLPELVHIKKSPSHFTFSLMFLEDRSKQFPFLPREEIKVLTLLSKNTNVFEGWSHIDFFNIKFLFLDHKWLPENSELDSITQCLDESICCGSQNNKDFETKTVEL